jgi:hypothetical protein
MAWQPVAMEASLYGQPAASLTLLHMFLHPGFDLNV